MRLCVIVFGLYGLYTLLHIYLCKWIGILYRKLLNIF